MRKSYSGEYKVQATEIVLDGDQSVPEVCAALGLGPTVLRRWVEQVREEIAGKVPAGAKAIKPEQQRIEELEALVRQKGRDIEILKNLLPGSAAHLGLSDQVTTGRLTRAEIALRPTALCKPAIP